MTDRDDIDDGHAIKHCEMAISWINEAGGDLLAAKFRIEQAKHYAKNVGNDMLFDDLIARIDRVLEIPDHLKEVGK